MSKEVLRDRITGMYLGIAIGDALGTPVELWPQERIAAEHGLIRDYLPTNRHKFHGDLMAGVTTDDTQLTLSVSDALVEAGRFDMEAMARHHLKAYNESTCGWGRSTRDSLENLKNGRHWTAAAAGTGVGNGIVMKIGPLAAYYACRPESVYTKMLEAVRDFSVFTHKTSLAVSSGLAHVAALHFCMGRGAIGFDRAEFVDFTSSAARLGEQFLPETLTDKLADRLAGLSEAWLWSDAEIREKCGKGSPYVYNSQPFSYAHFLRSPMTIDGLYECVSNGGDTDSNGSIMASLLGAMHGPGIFPERLVKGLVEGPKVLAAAQAFCAKFLP